jgi:hypothetical protein
LNDLWVKYRWNPTVTPCPVTAYITSAITTSCQPSQPPQATGTAARTARNGTTMKTASAICSARDCWSPPKVAIGSSVWSGVGGAAMAVAGVIGGSFDLEVVLTPP